MIERPAWRIEGFVSTTAQRALHAVEGLIPGVHRPQRRSRHRGRLPALVGAALAVGVGIVTAGSDQQPAGGSATSDDAARRPAGSTAGRPQQRGTGPAANGRGGRRSPAKGRGSGTRSAAKAASGARNLADKSRAELYEMARKAGVEGRSAMTKEELTKALSA